MSGQGSDRSAGFEARHAAIIAKTLGWADEAAARCDYVQAVRWVETVRRLGHHVPEAYAAKHEKWLRAIDSHRRALD